MCMSERVQISERKRAGVGGTHEHVFLSGQEPRHHHIKLQGFAIVIGFVEVVHGVTISVACVQNRCARHRPRGVNSGKDVRCRDRG